MGLLCPLSFDCSGHAFWLSLHLSRRPGFLSLHRVSTG